MPETTKPSDVFYFAPSEPPNEPVGRKRADKIMTETLDIITSTGKDGIVREKNEVAREIYHLLPEDQRRIFLRLSTNNLIDMNRMDDVISVYRMLNEESEELYDELARFTVERRDKKVDEYVENLRKDPFYMVADAVLITKDIETTQKGAEKLIRYAIQEPSTANRVMLSYSNTLPAINRSKMIAHINHRRSAEDRIKEYDSLVELLDDREAWTPALELQLDDLAKILSEEEFFQSSLHVLSKIYRHKGDKEGLERVADGQIKEQLYDRAVPIYIELGKKDKLEEFITREITLLAEKSDFCGIAFAMKKAYEHLGRKPTEEEKKTINDVAGILRKASEPWVHTDAFYMYRLTENARGLLEWSRHHHDATAERLKERFVKETGLTIDQYARTKLNPLKYWAARVLG